MNQYADLIIKKGKIIPVAEARYIHRYDSESPCVTALPPVREVTELVNDISNFPGLPPKDEFNRLTEKEQMNVLNRLNRAVVCLPYYPDIEENIDQALVDSYERRSAIESARPYREYTYNDKTQTGYCHMEITEMSDAPTGFCLLGKSGCGKSTGINSVLRKYPRVIVHNPNTMQQYVQIPIILVHMTENNNFTGLYQNIGKYIDAVLGNHTKVYETELGRKGDSLSVKFNKLCDLIRIFHIGMLIIDEIELISMKQFKEGTIETFMSLSNQTGIAIASVGTEDAFHKLFRYERITRRMGNLINADAYCSNPKSIYRILNYLYKYMLPDNPPLSQESLEAYFKESGGTIGYLSKLFVGVTKEVTRLKKKNKPSEITPTLIHRIAEKILANKHALDKNDGVNRIVEDDELAIATTRKLLGTNPETLEVPATPQKKHAPTLFNIVKAAIKGFTNNRYSDDEIESALRVVINKIPEDDIQSAINGTFIELNRRKQAKKEKADKDKKQKASIVDLNELRNSFTVSEDI